MAEPILSQEINDPHGYVSHGRYFTQPATFSRDVQHQGRVHRQAIAFADADATPSVRDGNLFTATNSAPTTITDFDDGLEGQEILIVFLDANTTVTNGGNIALAGVLDFVSSADDTMRLVRVGTTWYEVSRSVN